MERVQQEIEKTMAQVDRPGDAFRLWRDSGAFAVLAPALASMSDVALATLDLLPRARSAEAEQQHHTVNRLASLLLDVEPRAARELLRELRFSNERTRWIGDLIERWALLNAAMREALASASAPTDEAVRRWIAVIGRTRVDAFFALLGARFRAEAAEGWGRVQDSSVEALRKRASVIALRDPVEIGDLAVDGGDLMKVGIKAGPQLGNALRALLEWVLEDPLRNTHDRLLARARELAAEHSHD
jgi:tRNA nucleotidyltransferase (CCA-adding enzyme)